MWDKALLVTYYADPPFFTRKSVNEEYCRFFKVRPEQVIGRSCLETTPEKNRSHVQKKIEACIENDAVLVSIEPTLMSDGTTALMRWVEAPVKDRTGKIIEIVAIGLPLQDRRERKDRRQAV